MRPDGSKAVLDWLDRQATQTLYLTTPSLAELLVGIQVLPAGRRKAGLAAALTQLMAVLFDARILPFDRDAAEMYATLVGRARKAGCAMSVAEAQIGAIAVAHGFTVATRDTVPFTAAGVPVINPWDDAN
jgi:predicted nucleic acid-binding protein